MNIITFNNLLILIISVVPCLCFGGNYTSYLTGNNTDIITKPSGGICLMGGSREDDNAMRWFLQKANGGDVLVLRTSGADGYNSYLYSELGVPINSVESIVCHNKLASYEPYIIQRIQQAEAIWFAGGDQWTYISYWRNTPIDSVINSAIKQRNIVVGGTSAGMAIQGQYYFSAQNGTVTSAQALSDPFNNRVTIDTSSFIKHNLLYNTITETHFDNPDRKGRLVAFLARIITDYGVFARAIACDEYTAVCIDTNGIARVFGGHPNYDDNAYFIQSNCELKIKTPEKCSVGNPLTWDLDGLAIKTYKIKGDEKGSGTFDLNTWQSGTNGIWYKWYVSDGIFFEQPGTAINCSPLSIKDNSNFSEINIFPNPIADKLTIKSSNSTIDEYNIYIFNSLGKKLQVKIIQMGNEYTLDLSNLTNGHYYLIIAKNNGKIYTRKIIKD